MPTYKTPGVYVEETSMFPTSVAQVETAIPAFIGYTQTDTRKTANDLHMVPTRISSMLEYEQYYGQPHAETVSIDVKETIVGGATKSIDLELNSISEVKFYMHYCLQMYFANGGSACYIVSVGLYAENPNAKAMRAALGKGLNTLKNQDEPTLLLFTDTSGLNATQHNELSALALKQASDLRDRFAIIDVHEDTGNTMDDIAAFRASTAIRNANLSYGAAYYPKLKTTLLPRFTNVSVILKTHKDDKGNKLRYHGKTLADVEKADAGLSMLLLRQLTSEIKQHKLDMYPSSAIAGIYAQVDMSRGVWKAPANVSLSSVIGLTTTISQAEQDQMNVDPNTGKSVNAIRMFPGVGILVWGARTLAGNDNEWRYVSVRRFAIMVEESCKKSTERFVFEPNDANTWTKVRSMIENYLGFLWREGALAGAKPNDAFFVRCGLGETMTAQDITEGRLNVEIGMAVVRPAEFIISRFSLKMQTS